MTAVLFPILAVIIGYIITLLLKPTISSNVKLLLSFSGSFLLSITVFEFLPEVYTSQSENIGLFIMLGLIFQLLLEYISKGAEHGHVHAKDSSGFPWALFIGLCAHALFEGFPIATNESLLYGIVVHKIPIAIIISAFLFASKIPTYKSIIFLVGFAIMTPLGSLANQLIEPLMMYKHLINAFVVGILLHVSTTILFESSKNHQFNASKFAVILIGVIIAYFL